MKKTSHRGIYYRIGKTGIRTYYLRIRYKGHRTWKVAGPHLTDALNLRAKIELAQSERRYGLSLTRPIDFRELSEEYFRHYQTKAKARNWVRVRCILKQLNSFFGQQEAAAISPWTIEHYVRLRRQCGLDPATVNLELDYLRTILNKGLEWGHLSQVPKVARLPVQRRAKSRELTESEIVAVLEKVSPDHRDAVLLALDTGMRLGEIFRIKPTDLRQRGQVLYIGETKNLKSREIPLTTRTGMIIRRRLAKYKARMFKENSEGRLSYRFWLERKKLLEDMEPWRFHDLRHTFATRLLTAGIDPYTVMELLGHSKLEMVTRYLHTTAARKRDAIDRLPSKPLPGTKKRD